MTTKSARRPETENGGVPAQVSLHILSFKE